MTANYTIPVNTTNTTNSTSDYIYNFDNSMYSFVGKNVSNDTGLHGFDGKVMFMDTKLEKEIGLGPKWPFEPLGEGECLASTSFSEEYSVKLNDTIIFHFDIRNILNVIRHNYDKLAKENGWEKMASVPPDDDDRSHLAMNCTIVKLFSSESTYGKLPQSGNDDQIILEWKYWLSYFSKFLDERWASNQDLMNYMQTPGMQNQYAPAFMMTLPEPRFKYYQYKDYSKIKH